MHQRNRFVLTAVVLLSLAILTGCAATQVEKEYSSSVTHSVEKDNSPSVTHNIEEFVISSLHDVYRKKAAVLLGRDVYANELCAAFENESAMAVRVAWIIENAEYSKRMFSGSPVFRSDSSTT